MSVNPVRQWLQHVNDQLSLEGVEYLKLALYPFLKGIYSETERLTLPSKVYDFLLNTCFNNDASITLQWFVYSLDLLGGDLRGHRMVEDLQTYAISRPSNPQKMTKDQTFFECLTRIGRKARGLELEVKLIQTFSHRSFLNVNKANIISLPDLFIHLVQRNLISPTSTAHLEETLRKYGAKQCLFYLNEYHKFAGIEDIQDVAGSSRDDYPQTTEYHTTESSSDDAVKVKSEKRSWRPRAVFGFRSPKSSPDHQSLRTLLNSDSQDPDILSGINLSEGNGIDHESSGSRCRKCTTCVTVSVIAVSALFIIIGILFGQVWIHLIKHPNLDDVNVYENVTVVLGEVDRFYHQHLTITSDHVPLGQHKVDIYSYNSGCMQLPTVSKSKVLFYENSNTNATGGGFVNYPHLYLFPKSIIHYALDPEGDPVGTNNVEADQYVYITSGSEIDLFTPRTCQSENCKILDEQQYKGAPLHYSFTSEQIGYYNVHVRFDSATKYNFSLNITTIAIDRNLTTHECCIDEGNPFCQINLSFKPHSQKVCLMAYVTHPNTTEFPSYVTLEMKVTQFQVKLVLTMTIIPFMCSVVILLIVMCVFYCCCRKFMYTCSPKDSLSISA